MEYNNIIFKDPVALIYLLYTYISILNATYYLVTFLSHVSAIYGHHRCYPAKIVALYVKITLSRVNTVFPN
jgi:hypothetical protein